MMNKQMMYVMPVVTVVIGIPRLPGGLTLYWLTMSALTVLQQWYMLKKHPLPSGACRQPPPAIPYKPCVRMTNDQTNDHYGIGVWSWSFFAPVGTSHLSLYAVHVWSSTPSSFWVCRSLPERRTCRKGRGVLIGDRHRPSFVALHVKGARTRAGLLDQELRSPGVRSGGTDVKEPSSRTEQFQSARELAVRPRPRRAAASTSHEFPLLRGDDA